MSQMSFKFGVFLVKQDICGQKASLGGLAPHGARRVTPGGCGTPPLQPLIARAGNPNPDQRVPVRKRGNSVVFLGFFFFWGGAPA